MKDAAAWVVRAQRVTLRRLEDDLAAEPRTVLAFRAPPEVADLFLALVRRVGLARLLAHAITTWVALGKEFRDLPDFERDDYRCTVPGCTARRNLHSHHIWFRGRGGPDVAWNRTTVCAFHHQRAVHSAAGGVRIRGRAPDALVFELGADRGERFGSGDLPCAND